MLRFFSGTALALILLSALITIVHAWAQPTASPASQADQPQLLWEITWHHKHGTERFTANHVDCLQHCLRWQDPETGETRYLYSQDVLVTAKWK